MNWLKNLVFIIVFGLFHHSCNTPPPINNCSQGIKLKGERENLNVTIFIDLSDRISPALNPSSSMDFYLRDIGYIDIISKAFENHCRNKKVVQLNDQIRVLFHPLPPINGIDLMVRTVDKEVSRQTGELQYICSINSDYNEIIPLLYKETLKEKEPSAKQLIDDYPGSDIFEFFQLKAKDYCIKEGSRNILIVLTDGYMYMKGTEFKDKDNKSNFLLSKNLSKWGFNSSNYQTKLEKENFGFKTVRTDLDDLEVLVLGINAKNSWEMNVISHYWMNWLKEMGIRNFKYDSSAKYLRQADLPAEVRTFIEDFIYKRPEE